MKLSKIEIRLEAITSLIATKIAITIIIRGVA